MVQHQYGTSNVKQLDTPLSSQTTTSGQLIDYFYFQDQNAPRYRELTGGLYPIILKHFETINYIENQCVKLRQKIDHDTSCKNQEQIQLIQQLAQLSAQKLKLSYQTLVEVRNERDHSIYKEYYDQHKNDSDIQEKLTKTNNTEPFMQNEIPFSAAQLLQNVMYNSFTGVNGVQNILPIKQQQYKNNEWRYDEKHIANLMASIKLQLQDHQCNVKNTTLAVQEDQCGKDIINYNLAFLSCFYGQKLTAIKPQYDQANAVISAFSQIPQDEFQFNKRLTVGKSKNETLQKLQQKFIEISKEVEALWQDVQPKKQQETKFVPEKIKIGQIIQFGSFPFFSSVEGNQFSDLTTSTMSTTSVAESSQDLSQLSQTSNSDSDKNPVVFNDSEKDTEIGQTQQIGTQQTQIQSTQMTTQQLVTEPQITVQQTSRKQKRASLLTPAEYCESHPLPTKKCRPDCKLSDGADQMIQCKNAEKCHFAQNGWWHIGCLKLTGWNDFKQEFYCPGCWILKGNCFSDYVKDFSGLTSKGKDKVRDNANQIFINEYGVKLKRG